MTVGISLDSETRGDSRSRRTPLRVQVGQATYSLERRGDRNVPTQFLGAARWREYRGDTGYFVDFASGPSRYQPVEFNFENVCWVEITWNPINSQWDAVRPAGRSYNCDIDTRGLPTREQWGHIDGRPEEEPSTSEPRTPAPSETSGDDNEDSESDQEEPETNEIAQTAESLHITEPEVICYVPSGTYQSDLD
ncbi:hypothetical protein EDB85DRAFT_1899021 [Lactarius pseudohatsudake]|nr:hypothetical protein EDB85DRAFT_1899021 [Lactarius pseudohatsudake]